jgi:hypothetical protein
LFSFQGFSIPLFGSFVFVSKVFVVDEKEVVVEDPVIEGAFGGRVEGSPFVEVVVGDPVKYPFLHPWHHLTPSPFSSFPRPSFLLYP